MTCVPHIQTSKKRFRDGRTLEATISELIAPCGFVDPLRDPNFVLQTVVYDSKMCSLSNRRLFCLKQALIQCRRQGRRQRAQKLETVQVQIRPLHVRSYCTGTRHRQPLYMAESSHDSHYILIVPDMIGRSECWSKRVVATFFYMRGSRHVKTAFLNITATCRISVCSRVLPSASVR